MLFLDWANSVIDTSAPNKLLLGYSLMGFPAAGMISLVVIPQMGGGGNSSGVRFTLSLTCSLFIILFCLFFFVHLYLAICDSLVSIREE